jgi:hypothetical protein
MKDTINIEIDYSVFEYDNRLGTAATIKELLTAAFEHGRRDFKEGFNIQLTIRDCK